MNKITLLVLLVLNMFTTLQAQQRVGINVTTPAENLHVDSTIKVGKDATLGTSGRKNLVKFGDGNFVTIGEEVSDDRLYIRYGDLLFNKASGASGSGYIGINLGTDAPSAILDVNGSFRLRGNGAAAGAVLTSDANGNATWQAPANGNVYSVGSVDFKSDHGDAPVWVSGGNGGAYYTTAYYGNLVAPIHLPDGAKVTQIRIYYLDNNTSEDISFSFYGEGNTSSYTTLAAINTSGASSSYRLATITPSSPITIDNEAYNYQINAFVHWPGNSSTFAVKSVKFYCTY